MSYYYTEDMTGSRKCRSCDTKFKNLPTDRGFSIRVNREVCYICSDCIQKMFAEFSSYSLDNLCEVVENTKEVSCE